VNPQKPGQTASKSANQTAKRFEPLGPPSRPASQDPLDDPAESQIAGREAQRDPLERDAGEHPAGTASGAVVGGAAGMAMGSVAGPIGAVLGAGIGAVAGGLAGRGIAEAVNPTEEEQHWRQRFGGTQYAKEGRAFETCEPAYRYGWEACIRHGGRSFDEVESELGREWDSHRGRSDLGWMEARPAARDAWTRVQSRVHARSSSEGRMIT
jgi:hypothetical protein